MVAYQVTLQKGGDWGECTIRRRERIAWAYDARGILAMLALAVVYLATAKAGLEFSLLYKSVSPVWPASGVALAGLLLLGMSRWPAIFLGAFLATLFWHAPLLASLGTSVGSTLEAVLGVWLLRRLGFSAALERVQDVVMLVVVAAMGCALASALIGSTSLALVGALPWSGFWKAVWVWWGGDAMGIVVVTPVLLLLWRRRPVGRGLEAVALGGCTLLVCLGLFTAAEVESSSWFVGTFFFFPLAVWAALRFGPRGVALVTLFLTAFSLWGAMTRLGPSVSESQSQDNARTLVLWQLFIGVEATTCLLLAAASIGRQDATKRLELLATAVRGVGEGVVISALTPFGPMVVFANEAFRALVGLGAVELVGRSPEELAGEMDPETRQRLDAALREAIPFRGQVLLKHRDGSRVHSEMQLSPVRDADGRVTHFVSIHRDVTATQELRARLLAAERVAAVGTLAAGVGHEIQNPLAYLELNLAAAVRDLGQGGAGAVEALSMLREAQEGAERIRRIVQDLRMFSREGGEARRPVELREVTTPALRMVRHVLRNRARLVEDYSARASRAGQRGPAGAGAPQPPRQRGAGHPRGRAGAAHGARSTPARRRMAGPWWTCPTPAAASSPRCSRISSSRSSPPSPRRRAPGSGSPSASRSSEAHGGELLVRSEPGKGAVFTVLLPAAPGSAPHGVPEVREQTPPLRLPGRDAAGAHPHHR